MAQLKLMSLPIVLLVVTFSAVLITAGEARKSLPGRKSDVIVHHLGRQQDLVEETVVSQNGDDGRHRRSPSSASHRHGMEVHRKDSARPGHSPGVGHLTVLSAAQLTPDVRPTSPGHGLMGGSGHSIDNP